MVTKVLKNIKTLVCVFLRDLRNYSLHFAILRFLETFFHTIRWKKFFILFQRKKDKYVLDYLKVNFKDVFDKYNMNPTYEDFELKKDTEILPIWVCWLDGIIKAPLLVQKCIESIKKCAGKHPVIVITKDNYFKYVNLPDYIIEKMQNKQIQSAHFSDILRVTLIANYGGLWLDSTIYCTRKIPDGYFKYAFFTCKSPEEEIGCVSKNRWTTFCLGGNKNSPIFCCLRDFFFSYWKIENQAIDYLFFDDAIEVAIEYVPMIKKLVEQVPINNTKRDMLIKRFADPWQPECVNDLLQSDTLLYKLGYREQVYLKKCTELGQETVYSAFLNDFYLED